MQYEFTIYRDSAGGFRWRLQAGNNRIVADSGDACSLSGNRRSRFTSDIEPARRSRLGGGAL